MPWWSQNGWWNQQNKQQQRYRQGWTRCRCCEADDLESWIWNYRIKKGARCHNCGTPWKDQQNQSSNSNNKDFDDDDDDHDCDADHPQEPLPPG